MMRFVNVIMDFFFRIRSGLSSTLPKRFGEAYWIAYLRRDGSFIGRTESL